MSPFARPFSPVHPPTKLPAIRPSSLFDIESLHPVPLSTTEGNLETTHGWLPDSPAAATTAFACKRLDEGLD